MVESMELHGVHRDLLSFSERPEKPSSIKYGTNCSVLMFDQLLDSSGSESDIKINHVTHFRELNINSRSPAMRMRSSAKRRDDC